MSVEVGDFVRHTDTGRQGWVDDVTAMMTDDDKSLQAVAIRFTQDGTGMPFRVLESEVEIIRRGDDRQDG